jgi:putative acyl-CoA dehydrogenase
MQRRALTLALHHARHRKAFGGALLDKPVMRNVLCDLALESEATTALAMRLARTFDDTASDQDKALGRVLTPAAKFHVCKRGPQFAAEAMEVKGGNGYVEDSELPRIYREMPLLSIWEGSGNVMCLDVLRAVGRDGATVDALREEFGAAAGMDERLDRLVARLTNAMSKGFDEWDGRHVAHSIALAVQGSLLVRHAPTGIADAFCATRLGEPDWGFSFGSAPATLNATSILDRAMHGLD